MRISVFSLIATSLSPPGAFLRSEFGSETAAACSRPNNGRELKVLCTTGVWPVKTPNGGIAPSQPTRYGTSDTQIWRLRRDRPPLPVARSSQLARTLQSQLAKPGFRSRCLRGRNVLDRVFQLRHFN